MMKIKRLIIATMLVFLSSCDDSSTYHSDTQVTIVSVEKQPAIVALNGVTREPRIEVVVEFADGSQTGMICEGTTSVANWNTPYPRCMPLKPGQKILILFQAGQWRMSDNQKSEVGK